MKPHDFSKKRTHGPSPRYPLAEAYRHPHNKFTFIAGPCSVESKEQIYKIASFVADQGATHLRGGVFRAGTYPSDKMIFGWVDVDLIKDFHHAATSNGLKNIIEVLEYSDESLEMINPYASCFQVGARSMQNYSLLRKLGKYGKPVFLKRNTGATLDEWLGSAEHLLAGGVKELYLVERGSSTFHTDVRWTQTLHVIPSVKSICEIPVIVDASHGTGRRDLVPPMTLAGIAAGARGCLVETHNNPDKSISDSDQALSFEDFEILASKIHKLRSLNL